MRSETEKEIQTTSRIRTGFSTEKRQSFSNFHEIFFRQLPETTFAEFNLKLFDKEPKLIKRNKCIIFSANLAKSHVGVRIVRLTLVVSNKVEHFYRLTGFFFVFLMALRLQTQIWSMLRSTAPTLCIQIFRKDERLSIG